MQPQTLPISEERRFPTQESTSCTPASLSYSFFDGFHHFSIEFATGQMAEEEEGLSPLGQEVIDTQGHQVLPDGVVPFTDLGHLQNMVGRGNRQNSIIQQ